MRAAYVIGSFFFSTVMFGGSAWLWYVSGNGWWFVGGSLLAAFQGSDLERRINKWENHP